MSNAMRFGKRSLAAVAAGALAAGTLAFVGASPANATVTAIDLSDSGLQVIQDGTGDTARFNLAIFLTNASGDLVDLASNETITASVTAWPGTPTPSYTAANFVTVDSTQQAAPDQEATPTRGGVGTYAVDVTGTEDLDWDGTTAGTYNVRVRVANSFTGAVVDKNFPVVVSGTRVTPAASIRFTDSDGLATVNAASAVGGASIAEVVARVKMTNASGWALLFDPAMLPTDGSPRTLGAAFGTAITGGSINVTGGTTAANSTAIYTLTAAGAVNWPTGQNNSIVATYYTPTPTQASIPLTTSSGSVTAATLALTTTPNTVTTASNTVPVYEVPSGTSSLTFLATTGSAQSTARWTATSDAAGGSLTPSAGVSAIVSSAYSTVVSVNAAASADGAQMTFGSGGATATVDFVDPAPVITTGENVIAKAATAVTITGTVLDQWDRPLTGATAVSVSRVTPSTTAALDSVIPAADGSFTLTIPATSGPASPATYTYQVNATNGGEQADPITVEVNYTATGAVTSLTATTTPASVGGLVPAVITPINGTVNRADVASTLVNPANPAATVPTADVADISFTSLPSTSITVTGSEGVYMSTGTTATPIAFNSGATSVTVPSATNLRVWSTKAGLNTVTATAGGLTATAQFFAYVDPTAARKVELAPASITMPINSFREFTLKVTDIFGNPVPGVTVGATNSNVNVTLAGNGALPTAFSSPTGATGESKFSYTSPEVVGNARVTVTGTSTFGQFNTAITGFPAAVSTASSNILVEGTAAKSILIVGERTTVGGKPGIRVEGDTTGFDAGNTVKPWVRFPGQSDYTAGSARPTVSAAGDFTWQRKTGKKTYVYFTSDTNEFKSNRVIIAAN